MNTMTCAQCTGKIRSFEHPKCGTCELAFCSPKCAAEHANEEHTLDVAAEA